ncbi:MAG: hypothetical protein H6607_07915 [Flavobacteriales bacterium]|nr:hypothetical protein [Flavobacteriales bacterium]
MKSRSKTVSHAGSQLQTFKKQHFLTYTSMTHGLAASLHGDGKNVGIVFSFKMEVMSMK